MQKAWPGCSVSHTLDCCADTFIQKTKKLYLDTRTQRNLNKLTADVHEVTSIMTKNIQDILGQGEKMDSALLLHPLVHCSGYWLLHTAACRRMLDRILLLHNSWTRAS
jgi:hypothetical protein